MMFPQMYPCGMDWPARCVVILLVLWKSSALVRAVQAGGKAEIMRQGAYFIGFAALLAADLSLYTHPGLVAPEPEPWSVANARFLVRFPGLLFLASLASVFALLAAPRGTAKKAVWAKAAGGVTLAFMSLLIFVEVTGFHSEVWLERPRVHEVGRRRWTSRDFLIVGLGHDITLVRLDAVGKDRIQRLLCFYWHRRPAINI